MGNDRETKSWSKMGAVTLREFWEALLASAFSPPIPELIVEFASLSEFDGPAQGENPSALVVVSPKMLLDIYGHFRNDSPVRLLVLLEVNPCGLLDLSKIQQDLLPSLIAVMANRMLESISRIRFENQSLMSPSLLNQLNSSLADRCLRDFSAKEQFKSSPFELTSRDRFTIVELKNRFPKTARSIERPSNRESELPQPTHDHIFYEMENIKMSNVPMDPSQQERGLFDPPPPVSANDLRELRKHVVNLNFGKFSQDGKFTTSESDVSAIFNVHIPEWIEEQGENAPIRILLYAHGGLTPEGWGLYTAAFQREWWKSQGVYPIFFVWETGLLETLRSFFVDGQRRLQFESNRGIVSDLVDELKDKGWELAARRLGAARLWSGMKESARATFSDKGDGPIVLKHIKNLAESVGNRLEIHGVGHSAGSIFLSYAMEAAAPEKLFTLNSIQFLAPAITCELFRNTLKPLIGNGAKSSVNSISLFTMSDEYELEDTVGPYKKSLLYLISKALEPDTDTPILGLQKSLSSEADLAKMFGLMGNSSSNNATVVFSITDDSAPKNSRSMSKTHGDFDNDPSTMESVLRRIKKMKTGNVTPFPVDSRAMAVSRMMPLQIESGSNASLPQVNTSNVVGSSPVSGSLSTPIGNGRRFALCIGIDAYAPPNRLSGCVNDCKSWSQFFKSNGFAVKQLIDDQATRKAILDSLTQLFDSSQAGDVIAIQYSGHGTHVDDLNGDEVSGDLPGQDEALVPIDFVVGNLVIDDDLGELCRKIKPGVNVTFFMDCCHSGSNTRMFMSRAPSATGDRKGRFMQLPPAAVQAYRANRQVTRGLRAMGTSPYQGTREVLFAACRASEVAMESNGQGDFTRNALAILAQKKDLTCEEFYSLVLQQFGASARQTPGLWCDDALRKSPLLGSLP